MAVKKINYFDKEFNINYEILNNKNKKVIIFLHGWGANKETLKRPFKTFFKEYKHIYIDLAGFGKSENNYVLTTLDYANIIKRFLEALNLKTDDLIIIGHSFGGKVATILNPKYLVLLSSAGIIEEKSLKLKFKIEIAKLFSKIGLKNFSKPFRSSDVKNMSDNMYETYKNVVDEDFSTYFKSFKNKAIIFWGKDDAAVSLASGKKIHSYMTNSYFKSYKGGHYFYLDYPKNISEIITQQILEDKQCYY